MRLRRLIFVAVCTACCIAAQEKKDDPKSSDLANTFSTAQNPRAVKPKPADANLPSLANFEAFTGTTVPPGHSREVNDVGQIAADAFDSQGKSATFLLTRASSHTVAMPEPDVIPSLAVYAGGFGIFWWCLRAMLKCTT